ncbi:MAG: shikimate kinase [Polyangiaceae bacterium]
MKATSDMNLVLIGYRGTGKSTVSRRVAQVLGLPQISLDAEIVKRAGQSIADLVSDRGWDYFRDLETEVLIDCAARGAVVLDCGGGVVEREANFAPLRNSGTVFWLTATPTTVASRIADSRDRPALTQGQTFLSEVETVLARRTPLYARLAHVKIATDQVAPNQIADRILSLWPLHGLNPGATNAG